IVSNISGQDGLNIYYLASASGNEYLNGLTYNLTGGGFLIPVENAPVPVPPAVWLFISGFIGLVLMRKRNSCYEGVY
ncbi:MAG: VPLPA-CTERM sorting domain-containing protein, partial [Proteobacteria bacterium]|nr:VPLPA-CTERM sorting domain-containing protein [Pseudomonadota bacterium]